jgi:hypothetical protein
MIAPLSCLIPRRTVALGALFLAAALVPASARAHENGVLRLPRRTFTAGDTIALTGEKFGGRAELRLAMIGMRGRIELATVRTDSAGAFTARLGVPADAAEGAYRLVALAADGDEVATLDVTVAAPDEHAGHDTTAMAGMSTEQHAASAEPLALDRAHSGLLTAVTLTLAAVALGLGAVLVRRPRIAA